MFLTSYRSVLSMLTILAGVSTARSADWPQWRGLNRDGKSQETGLLKQWPEGGPALLWKSEDIGKGFSSPSVANGSIYITGDVGDDLMIFALDSNGKEKWKVVHGPMHKGSHSGSRSTPVIDNGKLYIIGGNGLITCHDVTDGRVIWKRTMQEFGGNLPKWGFSESVLILDNMAIVTPGGSKTAVVALDKTTGKDIWQSDTPAAAHYSSAIAIKEKDNTVIVQGTGDGLIMLDAKTGKQIGSNPWCAKNTANCPDPAFSDGYIFWANGYGKGGVCVKADFKDNKWNFSEAWTTKDMVSHHGGYIIEKGYIYGNHGGGWTCLDLKTGQKKWDGKGVGKGSISYADGMIYMLGENEAGIGLAVAAPDGFKETGSIPKLGIGDKKCWAHPVISEGRLLIRHDITLYCYDIKAK